VLLIRPSLRGLDTPPSREADAPASREADAPASREPDAPTGEKRRSSRPAWAVGTALSAAVLHIGGQRPGLIGLLLVGLALAGLVVCAPRLLPAGTFTARPGLPSVITLRGLASAAFILADVFLPLMLTRERGFSPTLAGLTVTVGGLSWCVASWYQGRWGQRLAPARRLQIGLGSIAIGIVTALLTVAPAVPVWVCVAGWAFGGLGMGLSYPTMSALTLQLSTPGEQGANSSALQLGESLYSTTVLAIGGSLFAALVVRSASTAYLTSFTIAEVLALLGVFVAVFRFAPRRAEARVQVESRLVKSEIG
jgi:MFS family permease